MLGSVGLVLPLLMATSDGFLITRVDPGVTTVKPGDSISMLCVVDSSYEYCKWTNPQAQICDFEWKRAIGNITTQECHGSFKEKAVFYGKYDDRECGITIESATSQDDGIWRCEVEEYVFLGSRGSGARRTGEIQVNVRNPTPAPTTTRSTTAELPFPIRTSTSKAAKATTQRVPTTTTTTTTTTQEMTSSRLPDPQPQPKSSLAPNSASEDPEASPSVQEDRETGGSSAGVVGGVLLALIIALAAVGGVFYYRRRKERVPIVNYATAADNANTGITIHSDRDQNTNFHEYFPPNMTYSTSTPQSDA